MLQLLVASGMVTTTILIHLVGLGFLLSLLRQHRHRLGGQRVRLLQLVAIFCAGLGLFALHTIEIWLYAALYASVGALPRFDEALYFSTVVYSTLGFGDILLPASWRLVGAIEAANGIILLGWSTAFFVSVIDRIRIFESEGSDE